MLVHFGDSGYDDQVLATARKLAARKRRGIHVLVTITVPNSLEIDAPMPDQDASARSVIEEAQGRRRQPRVGPRRARARGPGGAADRRGRGRDAGGGDRDAAAAAGGRASLFGKTLETVLTERPCRVIIESTPDGTRGGRRPARPRVAS